MHALKAIVMACLFCNHYDLWKFCPLLLLRKIQRVALATFEDFKKRFEVYIEHRESLINKSIYVMFQAMVMVGVSTFSLVTSPGGILKGNYFWLTGSLKGQDIVLLI